MQIMTVRLQGKEVQAALLNPDVAKDYEDGFDHCIDKINGAVNCGTGSEGIREQCQAVIDYVSDIFGDEGAKKVFGEQTDLLTCLDVLEEMQELYINQVNPVFHEKAKTFKEKLKEKGKSDS